MERTLVRAVTMAAAAQHGAIAVGQLRAMGMNAAMQRRAMRSAWLRAAVPGVVVLAGSEDTWHRRLRIGLLALGDEAWVSHEAAARLHGLDRAVEAVDFSMPRRSRRSVPPLPVHTTGVVGRLDLVGVEGFRCSSATRTIIDLAATDISTVRLEAAIDSAVRLGLSAPIVLASRLAELRGPGRHGARRLDRLLVDAGGESQLERRFLALVRRAGLPRPVTQRVLRVRGRHVARVDFLFPDQRVVVEVTGRVGHSSPADRGRDAQRRNEITDLGHAVYEYTWAHVTEQPDHVATTLRARLASRDRTHKGTETATHA